MLKQTFAIVCKGVGRRDGTHEAKKTPSLAFAVNQCEFLDTWCKTTGFFFLFFFLAHFVA